MTWVGARPLVVPVFPTVPIYVFVAPCVGKADPVMFASWRQARSSLPPPYVEHAAAFAGTAVRNDTATRAETETSAVVNRVCFMCAQASSK